MTSLLAHLTKACLLQRGDNLARFEMGSSGMRPDGYFHFEFEDFQGLDGN